MNERAINFSPKTPDDRKTAFGEFHAAFKINPAVLLSEFKMLFGFESENPWG